MQKVHRLPQKEMVPERFTTNRCVDNPENGLKSHFFRIFLRKWRIFWFTSPFENAFVNAH